MPLKVLLTGHNGYIGSVLGPFLQACGHVVVGFDSGLYRNCTMGPEGPGIPCIWKDVRDVDSDLLRRFDAVIHLAGIDVRDSLDSVTRANAVTGINSDAAVRLAKVARKARVKRFLAASSCGTASDGKPDAEILELSTDDFAATVLRIPQVIGWSPQFRVDLPVNRLAAEGFSTGTVRIPEGSRELFPLLHVEDAASAFAAALLTPAGDLTGKAIDIAFERMTTTFCDLGNLLRRIYPDCKLSSRELPEPAPAQADFDSVRMILPGYSPRWSVAASLQQMADAFCQLGWDPDAAATRRFDRAAYLQWLIGSGELLPDLRWKRGLREESASWAA